MLYRKRVYGYHSESGMSLFKIKLIVPLKEIEDEWRKFNNNSEPVKPSLQSTIDIREVVRLILINQFLANITS